MTGQAEALKNYPIVGIRSHVDVVAFDFVVYIFAIFRAIVVRIRAGSIRGRRGCVVIVLDLAYSETCTDIFSFRICNWMTGQAEA